MGRFQIRASGNAEDQFEVRVRQAAWRLLYRLRLLHCRFSEARCTTITSVRVSERRTRFCGLRNRLIAEVHLGGGKASPQLLRGISSRISASAVRPPSRMTNWTLFNLHHGHGLHRHFRLQTFGTFLKCAEGERVADGSVLPVKPGIHRSPFSAGWTPSPGQFKKIYQRELGRNIRPMRDIRPATRYLEGVQDPDVLIIDQRRYRFEKGCNVGRAKVFVEGRLAGPYFMEDIFFRILRIAVAIAAHEPGVVARCFQQNVHGGFQGGRQSLLCLEDNQCGNCHNAYLSAALDSRVDLIQHVGGDFPGTSNPCNAASAVWSVAQWVGAPCVRSSGHREVHHDCAHELDPGARG